ncbi:MAG: hypothetical protein WCT04_17970 [Planctomycetota bacterium]
MKPLCELDLPWKLLVTSFLIVLSSGFLMAELYLQHTTEMADGKEGMSMDDVVITFHGSDMPKLKQQIYGPMKKYFTESQDVSKLKADELADIEKIAAWVDKGAPKDEFQYEDREKNKTSISMILNLRGCVDCHAADATMRGNKHEVPLDTFDGVYKVAQKNPKPVPIDKGRLLSLSHIHLLGMGMMFMLLGIVVASTKWPVWLRASLIVGGHLSILLDIFGWWGVRQYGAPLAPVVMVGGGLMAASFGLSVAGSMWDLWIRKVKA